MAHFGGSGAHFGSPGAHSGSPAAHSGGPGRHFEDFWDYCDFGGRSATKKHTHFDSFFGNFPTFFSVIFLCFFEFCFFDLL